MSWTNRWYYQIEAKRVASTWFPFSKYGKHFKSNKILLLYENFIRSILATVGDIVNKILFVSEETQLVGTFYE